MPAFGYLRRTPSAGLLLVQLLGIVLYPWMETSPRGRVAFGVFGVLVLGVALRVVRRSPAPARGRPALRLPGMVLMWTVVAFAVLSAASYFAKFWHKVDEVVKKRRRRELLQLERKRQREQRAGRGRVLDDSAP